MPTSKVDYHERAIKAWDTRGRSGQGSGSAGRASSGDFGDAGAGVRNPDGTLRDDRSATPPRPGEPFVVYRLGNAQTNDLRGNAGNAEAVAAHIIRTEDNLMVAGNAIHAFEVRVPEEFGSYQRLHRGRASGEGTRVGRGVLWEKKGRVEVAYSFAPGANYTARKIGTITLEQGKAMLKARGLWEHVTAGGGDEWSWGGTLSIADGIREVFRR